MTAPLHRYLRYAFLGLRLLLPTPAEARYTRAIRRSGLFDRDWYLAANPRLPRICRWLPERHYVLVGEAAGLCPWPGFSPRAYRHLNPDLPAGTAPLAHYLASGRAAGRTALDRPAGAAAPVLPRITPEDHPDPPAPVAVVLHLYYTGMWPEFAARLAAQTFRFDLFVTLSGDPAHPDIATRDRILAMYPQARVLTLPNHGRDILPFLHLAQSGILRPYNAICKLHSKQSPHRSDGAAWRAALLDGVLGDPALTAARLARFLADPAAGFWVAAGHRLSGPAWWGPQNSPRAGELLARAGITLPSGGADFAAGSIWWVRAALLSRLAALPLGPEDFEPEMGQVDGTTAHALERGFGAVAAAAGLAVRDSAELDRAGGGSQPVLPTGAGLRPGSR